jgi:hypothetical protein
MTVVYAYKVNFNLTKESHNLYNKAHIYINVIQDRTLNPIINDNEI